MPTLSTLALRPCSSCRSPTSLKARVSAKRHRRWKRRNGRPTITHATDAHWKSTWVGRSRGLLDAAASVSIASRPTLSATEVDHAPSARPKARYANGCSMTVMMMPSFDTSLPAPTVPYIGQAGCCAATTAQYSPGNSSEPRAKAIRSSRAANADREPAARRQPRYRATNRPTTAACGHTLSSASARRSCRTAKLLAGHQMETSSSSSSIQPRLQHWIPN